MTESLFCSGTSSPVRNETCTCNLKQATSILETNDRDCNIFISKTIHSHDNIYWVQLSIAI